MACSMHSARGSLLEGLGTAPHSAHREDQSHGSVVSTRKCDVEGFLAITCVMLAVMWFQWFPQVTGMAFYDPALGYSFNFANYQVGYGTDPGDIAYDSDIVGLFDQDPTYVCSLGSTDGSLCKGVSCTDDQGDNDGCIETGEIITCRVGIRLRNDSGEDWLSVLIKDRNGAEWGGDPAQDGENLPLAYGPECVDPDFVNNRGRSKQVRLEVDYEPGSGPPDGERWRCFFQVSTDLDPAGDQQFEECGYHVFNSGVVAKVSENVSSNNGKKQNPKTVFSTNDTGKVLMCVINADNSLDCDEDGISDGDELGGGTDPCDVCDPDDTLPGCPNEQI